MQPILDIQGLNKVYGNENANESGGKGGFHALKDVNLQIHPGEIFALLGPNGAGKTTMISIICGITNLSSGRVLVDGSDIVKDYKKTREMIGLVPQELTSDAFESVWNTVSFSRGLFGKPKNPDYIEKILKDLSLWDKRNNRLMTLSGGMKRRVLIAKALSHEPKLLFLDEPTAGVDVELRKEMWDQVHQLRSNGVTIILTTHYIEEAEEMADRVGVINQGQIVLVEEKNQLMKKMGTKELSLDLKEPLNSVPDSLKAFDIQLDGQKMIYRYDSKKEGHQMSEFLEKMNTEKIFFTDLSTKQSSLEEIFIRLVKES